MLLTPAQSATIDAAVHDVMRDEHISGLALAVARNGRIILLRGYGKRDDKPVSGATVFRIGSLTKQFTAALVLQQIERGALSFQTVAHGATVQALLTQTSGIPNVTSMQPDQIAAALTAQPLFAPGTNWAYSNTNYLILGSLLQASSHMPFPTLLARQITQPLHLESTRAPTDDAAAGMTSTASDLVTWLGDLGAGRVVDTTDLRAMTSSAALLTGERTHYGYGFYVRDWYGWAIAEHPGYVDGASADDALVVDDGLAIAVLADATNAYLVPITKTIVSTILPARDPSLVADFTHPAENENPAVTATVRALVAELATATVDRSLLSQPLDAQLDAAELARLAQMLKPLGPLTLVEFIGRSSNAGNVMEKYRLTFGYKQYWMRLTYLPNGKIDALSIEPDRG